MTDPRGDLGYALPSGGRHVTKFNVLAIGDDEALLTSRVAILRRDYQASFTGTRNTMQRLQAEHFDLLLVCHSIPFEQANALIQSAHEAFPRLCIVRLRTLDTPPILKPVAHAIVTIDHRPMTWMKAVNRLLTQTA